jgi:hypothetical protein
MQKWECAIFEFHGNTTQRLKGWCKFEKLKNYWLILAKHFTACNAEEQTVANLACGAGNGNTNGSFHRSVRKGACGKMMSSIKNAPQGGV